jgi:aldose 1-epimerase
MRSQIVTITDSLSGTSAQLLPHLGFNCFRFQAQLNDQPFDVLWAEPGFEDGTKRPSGSGIPLLFPFPGRIAGTTLLWDAKEYDLEPGDGQGNAIHGFVHERPWRVIEQEPARVVGQFQASQDDPRLLQHWPSDFRITATYEVSEGRLTARFVVENPDDHTLPCGFGIHPYFRLPVGGQNRDDCLVRLPVSSNWELTDMNATGKKIAIQDTSLYHRGQRFGTLSLDNVFSDLVFAQGHCEASIEDPESGKRVTIAFDRSFRECVVYTPPHREAICIEPYSCVPDPFRLERNGINAGLWSLTPGELLQAQVEIRLQ